MASKIRRGSMFFPVGHVCCEEPECPYNGGWTAQWPDATKATDTYLVGERVRKGPPMWELGKQLSGGQEGGK